MTENEIQIDKEIQILMQRCVQHHLNDTERNILYEYFRTPQNFEKALIMFTEMLGMDIDHLFDDIKCPLNNNDCKECNLHMYMHFHNCISTNFKLMYLTKELRSIHHRKNAEGISEKSSKSKKFKVVNNTLPYSVVETDTGNIVAMFEEKICADEFATQIEW